MATLEPGCDLAVEHAALEAGRQDVAQHDQRLFVGALGNRVQAGVGMGNAHELGLRAVDACCPASSRRSCNASTCPCGKARTGRRR